MRHVTNHIFVFGVTVLALVMGGAVAPIRTQAQRVEPIRSGDAEVIRANKEGVLKFAEVSQGQYDAPLAQPKIAQAGDTDNRLVFQSYRTNDWQIYSALGDGSSQTQLTFDTSVANVSPKLRYGGIAIAMRGVDSNNNSQIRTILKDGSRYRGYLSTGKYVDLQWSPDGLKLAYAKETASNFYDVFLADYHFFNETLSGEICLTCGSGANSSEPTWSPDGTHLIFMRRNNTQATGQIWRMNITGQNPQQLTGDLWYLQDLVWSPDGTRVAFDSALNKNAWNQLRVLNLTDNSIVTIYDPAKDLVDAWMGDWSPDGIQIYFTRVEYAVQDNQLVLKNTWTARVAASGGIPALLAGNTGRDMQPNIEKRDLIAPRSRVLPLPKFSKQLSAFPTVHVDEPEPGGAELAMTFDNLTRLVPDIQRACRFGINGDWNSDEQCWNRFGEKVYFRSGAKDNEGNIEAWPTNPDYDTSTTFYRADLTGTVTDNRGYPTTKAEIAFVPTAFYSTETEIGQYFFLFASPLNHNAFISKPGFLSPPPLKFLNIFSQGSNFQSYLYPVENIIQNGNLDDFVNLTDTVAFTGWATTRVGWAMGGPHSGNGFAALQGGLSGAQPMMSQVVTIPAEMRYPTLAFLYRYDRTILPPTAPVFAVSVSNGLTDTFALSTSGVNRGWQMKWIDMQQWSGQTITLSFLLSGTSHVGSVFSLDGITLGSWLTPVPTQTNITQLPANAPTTPITITGTNFIATPTLKLNNTIALGNVQWLTETQLTADLPANLPPGIYDLWVTNPGGQESVLPNAIKVGRLIYLPMARKDD